MTIRSHSPHVGWVAPHPDVSVSDRASMGVDGCGTQLVEVWQRERKRDTEPQASI